MQAVVGFVMVLALVFCLIKRKVMPPVAFILFPIIAALICGFNIFEIGEFAADGISGMVKTVSLFVFSIAFFSLMSDAGIFDVIVNKLTKAAGSNVAAIMIATAAIAVVGHLDGSGATTYVITTAAMLPIFKKMNLDKRALMLITSMAIGVMNLVPWGGPTMRAASVLEMDSAVLWHPLIPIQGVMLVLLFIVAFLQSRRKGIVTSSAESSVAQASGNTAADTVSAHSPFRKSKGILALNYVLTIGVIALLVQGDLNSAFVFMIGLAIGLIINVPSLNDQSGLMKKYGTAAMSMVVTLFSAGIFTGVLNGTGILDSMAQSLVTVIPAALGPYTHFIIAAFAVPIIMCLGTDAFYYGLMPVVIGVCANYGVSAVTVATTLLIAENVGVTISPLTPAVYLGLGALDLDIGDHIKYSIPWVWAVSILSVVLGVILGVIPLS